MIFVCILALLLFGPKKLPELGRLVAKGLTEFRRAKSELKSTFDSHMQELERETRLADESSKSTNADSTYNRYSSTPSYPYDEQGPSSYDYSSSASNGSHPVSETSSEPAHTAVEYLPKHETVADTVPRSSSAAQSQPEITEHEPAEREEKRLA